MVLSTGWVSLRIRKTPRYHPLTPTPCPSMLMSVASYHDRPVKRENKGKDPYKRGASTTESPGSDSRASIHPLPTTDGSSTITDPASWNRRRMEMAHQPEKTNQQKKPLCTTRYVPLFSTPNLSLPSPPNQARTATKQRPPEYLRFASNIAGSKAGRKTDRQTDRQADKPDKLTGGFRSHPPHHRHRQRAS